ncbi:MAG TPA: hypothetical protein VGX92_01860 [Pyrinomonadaceae bacterium]|nr:hypothetical protein [Pyrinomonadaceae bacterium]
MKNIRQVCAAAVLTLTLAFTTFAGVIQAPGVTTTSEMSFPGVTAQGVTEAPGVTAMGDMQTPGATTNPMTEMALGFLLNLSSLL